MMDIYDFHSWSSFSPTQIYFGTGKFQDIATIAKPFGSSALIVCGYSAQRTGSLDTCCHLLTQQGISYQTLSGIKADPSDIEVDKIVASIQATRANMLIALGGGSVIDAVKAASVIAATSLSTESFLCENLTPGPKLVPVIAIPTTAGTGAELSKGAIISCPARGLKSGIRGNSLIPDVAIVDPALTLTLSWRQTSITGFDILTHAIESFISKKATPITSIFSLFAIERVTKSLLPLLKQPQDIKCRTDLSFASMLMGYNLANASTCLPHRLQYPLSVLTGTEHALGLAALYPNWIRCTQSASEEKFQKIADLMQQALLPQAISKAKADMESLMRLFLKALGLPQSLGELGVNEAMCQQMALSVSGALDNDPWWQNTKELLPLYCGAL